MKYALALILTLASLSALAGEVVPPQQPKEPTKTDLMRLLAVGGVGGVVLWARNKNKKK
jgi:uncharacterized protein involved in exopolysaccharide biosynthesis